MSEKTLTWSGYRPVLPPTGCIAASLLVNPVTWPGYAVATWLHLTSRPLWWSLPLFLPHALALIAVLTAAFGSRLLVDTAEFTAYRVTLRGASHERTVAVADLTTVAVEHHGSVGAGYTHTSLRLGWSLWNGSTAVSLIGPHDPALASSLTDLLGRRVGETWVALHDTPLPEPPGR